jgi:glycosyltransferase involved in cell wall biosynthesis
MDHQTGAVVETGDIKALSKAVLAMFKNKATIDACRQRAKKYFNKEDRYKEYLSIYNQLITQN